MKPTKLSPPTLATQLHDVQKQLEVLEEQEKSIKAELIATLKKQGVKSIRLEDGTTYTRSHRESLVIKDDTKALEWAQSYNVMKIDTGKAMQVLRRELKLPKFFGIKKGEEYLTVSKK